MEREERKMNNIYEWLTKCREHECDNKIFELHDDPPNMTIGHKCDCGEIFTVSIDKKTTNNLTGFPERSALTIISALSSSEGRLALMCSCFDANKLK